ncbi:phosphate/phosphite/phosphonate ABC transporter substrate-binding protein [Deefgea piscis]|uniref:Phosphate/phosphite/phosphonate ABC transporter substrate-binding protein n=1 Tax=Deefgea piscis TaxID=2739061 RepID=A0A6M8SMJ7_9NEIS|nr:phosphate/phosphite/phosphonate ABC transporter substrate-binding protein [Deefgea piscis]QKJ65364.1 phosphate/phosphite/phosphonate ABC transporter substrate-binding protein [Deefgea piscis]
MSFRPLCLLLCCLALPAHADITVGLLTSRNDEQTLEDWQPILNDLAAVVGQPVKAWVGNDRAVLLNKIKNNEIQVARVDNKLALDAVENAKAEVFASLVQSGNQATYRSVMLVRANSPIKNAEQLLQHPQQLNYASGIHGSTAEYYIPHYHLFLQKNIIPENYFKHIVYGNAEQSFIALATQQVDVAVSNSFDLEQLKEKYPRDHAKMRLIWQSPEFAFDPLIQRQDLPAPLKNKIKQFFTQYGKTGNNTAQAKQRLYYADQLAGFIPADNRSLRQVTDLQLFHDLFKLTLNKKLAHTEKTQQEENYYKRYRQLTQLLGGAK